MVSPSIRYLLPLAAPERASSSLSPTCSSNASNDSLERDTTVGLYAQARPLVHPQSSAAIKTLGKILDDPELVRRMLQRSNQRRSTECSRVDSKPSGGAAAALVAGAIDCRRHRHAIEQLQCLAVCEELVLRFEPRARVSHTIRLTAVKPLLTFYRLDVDAVAYRRWLQQLPEDMDTISVTIIAQVLQRWCSNAVLLECYHEQQTSGLASEHMALTLASQLHNHIAAVNVIKATKTHTSGSTPALGTSQSAPLLHPFTMLTQHSDAAKTFDYEACAKSQATRISKTLDETAAHKSEALIHATHALRRKTKTIRNHSILAPSSANASSLPSSASTPSFCSATFDDVDVTTCDTSSSTHTRLHQEKLARDVLRRCSTLALAPSQQQTQRTAIGSAQATAPALQQQQRQQEQKQARQARQQRTETAKAFTASVAMISRHIQHEELCDVRETQREVQQQRVDDRKHWSRVHRAHCRARADDCAAQQQRDVHAMKTIAKEELALVQSYLQLRQDVLQRSREPFALTESTKTLVHVRPEVLAAHATGLTAVQKRQLLAHEREHLEHARSLQLLDYVYDKRRAVLEAHKPKADAALVDVALDAAVAPVDDEPTLGQLLEHLRAQGQDLSAFLPPTNSPPAALRYFGTSRPVPLPPFASSVGRQLASS